MVTGDLLALLGRLLDEAHVLAPGDLVPLLRRELDALEFTEVVVYVVDHEQRRLVPVPPAEVEAIGIDTTLGGRVYQTSSSARAGSEPERLWLPIRDGVERLGVLMLARAPRSTTNSRRRANRSRRSWPSSCCRRTSSPTSSSSPDGAGRWRSAPRSAGVRSRR